jgi:PAS domain S-box-containing protein
MPPPPATDAPTADEQRRLQTLHGLEVLDTLPEPVFDAITTAAANACGVPIALVSLVDLNRQWFKSNIGLPGVDETPRSVAFCDHAIRGDDLLEIADATADARFAANPLVTGDPRIRFYAGAPIVMPDGQRVGTVCVIDRAPRTLTPSQRAMLEGLGRVASVALTDRQHHSLAQSEARYRALVEDQSELVSLAHLDGRLVFVNAAFARHYGLDTEQFPGRQLLDFVPDDERESVARQLHDVATTGLARTAVNRVIDTHGRERWVTWTNRRLDQSGGALPLIHSVGSDITERRLAEEHLIGALREKETLLKEVYHRVKNNLQMVQSLLSLQQRSTDEPSARKALSECSRRVRAMALVHEKLYQSGNLAEVSLRAYTDDLLAQIDAANNDTARKIQVVAEVDDRPCGLDAAVPFGMLVAELVANAMEHGFGERSTGRVWVRLQQRDATPWLTVSDDGVGLRTGFNLATTTSMGLQLAMALAAQLGGALEARNDGGAVFGSALPRL